MQPDRKIALAITAAVVVGVLITGWVYFAFGVVPALVAFMFTYMAVADVSKWNDEDPR